MCSVRSKVIPHLWVRGSWPHAGSVGHIRSHPGDRRRSLPGTWPWSGPSDGSAPSDSTPSPSHSWPAPTATDMLQEDGHREERLSVKMPKKKNTFSPFLVKFKEHECKTIIGTFCWFVNLCLLKEPRWNLAPTELALDGCELTINS